MQTHKATTTIKTTKGTSVVVTARLVLAKTIYADGDNITVDCCEMGLVTADISGHPQQAGYREFAKPIDHPDYGPLHGCIGQLGLTAHNIDKVKALIAELQQHPAWIAKQAAIAKNQAAIATAEEARNAHPGYCQRCGSYCWGDCEANA